MPAALTLSGVTKRYRGRVALNDIACEIRPGSATALLGVNGAGKSTLMRSVLDLIHLDAGRIDIFGVDHRLARARAPLAWLGERFVPPHIGRGREVLELLCALQGASCDPQRVAAECAALQFDVAALERPARDYSKGMQQKLGLIACLLADRPLLLLDEPMSGLDPLAHALIRARLRALREAGTTLLFSTHALRDVTEICDRVLVLHAGRLVFDGGVGALAARDAGGDLEHALLALIESLAAFTV